MSHLRHPVVLQSQQEVLERIAAVVSRNASHVELDVAEEDVTQSVAIAVSTVVVSPFHTLVIGMLNGLTVNINVPSGADEPVALTL